MKEIRMKEARMNETPMVETDLTRDAGIEIPIICGAMYPCSNPELVAAASQAGGLGVIQPVSMEFVHRHSLAEGIRLIRSITDKPVGFNALVERSSAKYERRMQGWVETALEMGIRFFITALGDPAWVVRLVHEAGGKVYHDATELKWAQKALDKGVDGLICVNNRAGGHTGPLPFETLFDTLSPLKVPLVCAGGVGSAGQFCRAMALGYAGVQMGTRFIATRECSAHEDYKQAILNAREEDIVLTEKISGVPVSVIETPFIRQTGTRAGWLAKKLLRHPKGKHYMRTFYALKSVWQLKQASTRGTDYKAYFLAGKSADPVRSIEPAGRIVRDFYEDWARSGFTE